MSDHDSTSELHDPVKEAETNPGGTNGPIIAFVGAVSIVLVWVIIVATQAWFYSQGRQSEEQVQYREAYTPIVEYNAEQAKLLSEPSVRWVEGEADFEKRVSVPLDTAIDKYLSDEKFRGFSSNEK